MKRMALLRDIAGPSSVNNKKSGFTLIELLISIGILGILAAAVVLVLNPVSILENTRTKATQSKLNELADLIIKLKGFSGKTSLQITGSGCSDCSGCRDGTPVNQNQTCIDRWRLSLTAFQTEGVNLGITTGLSSFTNDAWGSPFLLDENEGEGGGCSRDFLRSAGPDKIYNTSDDIYPYKQTNYIINVSPACAGL